MAKETLVAKSELAAYLISWADLISQIMRSPEIGACKESKIFWAFLENDPITILSGCKVSSIAVPSLKNSGQAANSKRALAYFLTVDSRSSSKPMGIVLLMVIKVYPVRFLAVSSTAAKRYERSASPFSFGGVPTQIKTICDLGTDSL